MNEIEIDIDIEIFLQYYPKVFKLKEFLNDNLPLHIYQKLDCLDIDTLDKTVIVLHGPVPCINCYDFKINLKDIISCIVCELLKFKRLNCHKDISNVIAYGARMASRSNMNDDNDLVEYCLPNDAVNRLGSSQWEKIFNVVGSDMTFYLVQKCSIFEFVSRNNFIQLCGMAISEIEPLESKKSNGLKSILVKRHRIFYSSGNYSKLWSQPSDRLDFFERGFNVNGRIYNILNKNYKRIYFKKLLEYHCIKIQSDKCDYINAYRVSRFVISITRKLFKNVINNRVQKVIEKKITLYVSMRRHESMTLHDISQGISTESFFVAIQQNNAQINGFLFWIFDHFIRCIIRRFFYVTESGNQQQRTVYYLLELWKKMTKDHKKDIVNRLYEKFDPSFSSALTCSPMRLLPKEDGFRPIVNMNRGIYKQISDANFYHSKNGTVKNLFEILNFLKRDSPKLLGTSVFGYDDILRCLLRFKEVNKHGPFFMFKFDIERCFDSISHSRILKTLDIMMKYCPDQLIIKKYNTLSLRHGQIKKEFKRHVCKISEINRFEELIEACHKSNSTVIFIDKAIGSFHEKVKIFNMLRDHVKNNIISLDGALYRQNVGLPQGSILSTLICSYVYGCLDQLYFKEFIQNPKCLLMRYVDDYILISTERPLVDKFVNVIAANDCFHPDFGFKLNTSKCRSNFYNGIGSETNNHFGLKFHWCGLDIDTLDLSISAYLEKFFGTYSADSLTVSICKRSLESIGQRLNLIMKPYGRRIFNFASKPGKFFENVITFSILLALKLRVYIKELRRREKRICLKGKRLEKIINSIIFSGTLNCHNRKYSLDNAIMFNLSSLILGLAKEGKIPISCSTFFEKIASENYPNILNLLLDKINKIL